MGARIFLLVVLVLPILGATALTVQAQERRGREVSLAAESSSEDTDSFPSEYKVPSDVSYFEIGKVSGGVIEVLEPRVSLLDGSDSKKDRVRVALLRRGVQVPTVPVAPGAVLRFVEGEGTVTAFGIEVRNEMLHAVLGLREQMTQQSERIVVGLEKASEQTATSSEDLVAELDKINETIISARYKVEWDYRIVEIKFKHVGDLAKLLVKRGKPDYELFQVLSGERRPGQHKGEVTAIYRRAKLPESMPKLNPHIEEPTE